MKTLLLLILLTLLFGAPAVLIGGAALAALVAWIFSSANVWIAIAICTGIAIANKAIKANRA